MVAEYVFNTKQVKSSSRRKSKALEHSDRKFDDCVTKMCTVVTSYLPVSASTTEKAGNLRNKTISV
jgi:hypothetical protein